MQSNTKIGFLKESFRKASNTVMLGSIIFELSLILHNYFLMRYIVDKKVFGTIGTIFAIVYSVVRIIDLGATNAIPPYFTRVLKSRWHFKKIFLFYLLLPSFIFSVFIIPISLYFFYSKIFSVNVSIWIVIFSMISESLRSFLRLFLHVARRTYQIIYSELLSFLLFLILIWGPILFFQYQISIKYIFVSFFIYSFVTVLYFIWLTVNLYFEVPIDNPNGVIGLSRRKFFYVRATNLMLRISRDIFSYNLLTPLFALKCGLEQAGFFYFSSQIARSLQEVIKGQLIYPGNAWLATLKVSTLTEKRIAFSEISLRLFRIIVGIVIFLTINYNFFFAVATTNVTNTMIVYALLFLFISLLESCFVAYEQFFIIEEATGRLFALKIIDFIFFYFFVLSQKVLYPTQALLSIILIRLCSITLVAFCAYLKWRIKPNVNIGKQFIFFWIAISLIIFFIISIYLKK